MYEYKNGKIRGKKSRSKRDRVRDIGWWGLAVVGGIVAFVVAFVVTVAYFEPKKEPPLGQQSRAGQVDIAQIVTLKTESDIESFRLGRRKDENRPVQISDKEDTLWFWSYHPSRELELTFSFRDTTGNEVKRVFEWKPRRLPLLPKSVHGAGSKKKAGPPNTLVVSANFDKIKAGEAPTIELWVCAETDTVKIPVVLLMDLPRAEDIIADIDESPDLFLRMGEDYRPLGSIAKLEVQDTKRGLNLVFKYQGKKKVQLQCGLERAGETLEEDVELKPKDIKLSTRNPSDSAQLAFLSDSLFDTRPRNIELVISRGEGKEPFRIPIYFRRKLEPGWGNYVLFRYGIEDIDEFTTLPFKTDWWKEIQITNDTDRDISVSYQVAIDSQDVKSHYGGTVTVDKNSTEPIPWHKRTAGATAVTFEFQVTSGESAFDTTFVLDVSGGPLHRGIGRFFNKNWLTILLCLLIAGLGYVSYELIVRVVALKRERNRRDELLREREKEISGLKTQLGDLKRRQAGLTQQPVQAHTQPVAKPSEDATTELRALEEEHIKNVEKASELELTIQQKDLLLRQIQGQSEGKGRELEGKDSAIEQLKQQYSDSLTKQNELTEQASDLSSSLRSKEKTIDQNTREIGGLKTEVGTLGKRLDILDTNLSHLKQTGYPKMMHQLLLGLVDLRIKSRDENKTSKDVQGMLEIYREFERVKAQAELASATVKSGSALRTTYNPGKVLAEVQNVSVFIDSQLGGLFSSERDFEFSQIDSELEKSEDMKDKYDKDTQRHLENVLSKIEALDTMIDSGKDLQSNEESVRKHVLEEVANQVFITCAELESAESGVTAEVKGVFRRIKEHLSLLITRFYELQPMEIRLGQDYDSEHFQIVGHVEGEADSRYSRYGRNSIVSITSWGYYKAGTKKVEAQAKVQVKK